MPPVLPNDREAVEAALATLYLTDPSKVRAVRLRDTRNLEPCYATQPVLQAFAEVLGPPAPLPFGPDGNLLDLPR